MICVTSGKGYIDIDAYASCIAYRELLVASGINAKAISTAPLNESVCPIIRKIPFEFDKYTPTEQDKFIVLDVSDPEFFDNIVNQSSIIEILDHHIGYEKHWQNSGVKNQIEKVGSVATQIYEKYMQSKKQKHLSSDLCKLLVAAIVNNTLNLKSTMTISRDKFAFDDLMKIGNINKNFAQDYFNSCEQSIFQDFKQAIINDTKRLDHAYLPKKLGQLALFNHDKVLARSNEIVEAYASEREWAINIVSLKDGASHIFSTSKPAQEKLSALFLKSFNNNVLLLNNFLLRKEIIELAQMKNEHI